jgi:Domain of unknown function (DUF5666)
MRGTLLSVTVLLFATSQISGAQAAFRPGPGNAQGEKVIASDLQEEPPLPKGHATLLGGTVTRVDPIRDRLVVRAFGGRDVTIDFDVRTQVMRGATPASIRDVRPGARVYADTIANNGRVFAKSLRLEASSVLGETRGQVLGYDSARGLLKVRDVISSQPINLRVSAGTKIRSGEQAGVATDLVNGALVQIDFQGSSEGPSVADSINILARPGSMFIFTGRIAVIDLRDSHLTLYQQPGDTAFEVGLGSLTPNEKLSLKLGTDVVVHAQFDGRRYEARSIELASAPQP